MGETFCGPFELHHCVAAGATAEIFFAFARAPGHLDRPVALKRLRPHKPPKPELVELFQAEARLLAALNHPGVPQVYALGEEDRRWYMALEWIEGGPLVETLGGQRTGGSIFPAPVAANIATAVALQVCDTLEHVHNRRDFEGAGLEIVHRDVTPRNLLLTNDGFVKLIDFGVATSRRTFADDTRPRGTYPYMAPEQILGEKVDRRADIFALGVVLYELTTGVRPFRGDEVAVMSAIVERSPAPPSDLLAGFPDELEQIILRALSRSREDRFPSAAQFGRALRRFALRSGWFVAPSDIAEHLAARQPREPGSG